MSTGQWIVNRRMGGANSPFPLRSDAGARGSPGHGVIGFRPGTTAFTDGTAASVDKIANAMADRRALQATVSGVADPQAGRAGEQQDWLRPSVDGGAHAWTPRATLSLAAP